MQFYLPSGQARETTPNPGWCPLETPRRKGHSFRRRLAEHMFNNFDRSLAAHRRSERANEPVIKKIPGTIVNNLVF